MATSLFSLNNNFTTILIILPFDANHHLRMMLLVVVEEGIGWDRLTVGVVGKSSKRR